MCVTSVKYVNTVMGEEQRSVRYVKVNSSTARASMLEFERKEE